jgi:Zn-dependent M28 family amino/carboxypeptidase
VRRGACPFLRKALNAQRAGAAAVLIVNNQGTGAFAGTLGAFAVRIPVLALSAAGGRALADADGEVTVEVDAASRTRRTYNLIAERRPRPTGAPIVMAGAHLDSVPAGAGINDNASGVALVLEAAEELAAAQGSGARLRFAFWGAEELGLFGSRRYVASLAPAERRRLAAYLNFDMVGSPNGAPLIYAARDRPADERVARALRAAARAHDVRLETTRLGGASDHAPFASAGVPVGGLFTGASERKSARQADRHGGRPGRALDPCYHQACDTRANLDPDLMTVMARVAARALADLAHRPPAR